MDTEKSNLPSKNILSLLIVVCALVFSIVIISGKGKSTEKIESLGNIVSGEKITIPQRSGWQDELDTIGDNTQATLLQETETEEDTSEKTYTDKVSETLLSNYLVLKQNGQISTPLAQDLVNQTQDFIESDTFKTFRRSQLTLLPDGDTKQMQEYGEVLGLFIKANKQNGFINELSVLQEAMVGGDMKKLSNLATVAKTYEKMSYNLMMMGVPVKFADAHLDMANSLKRVSVALADMANMEKDPILGLEGMKKYQDGAITFINAMRSTAEYLKSKNITYKQGSGGYYLFYGI